MRTLIADRHLAAAQAHARCSGTGATTSGRVVPDGVYRVRVTLHPPGPHDRPCRAAIPLDTKPPRPLVQRIGRDSRGPAPAAARRAPGDDPLLQPAREPPSRAHGLPHDRPPRRGRSATIVPGGAAQRRSGTAARRRPPRPAGHVRRGAARARSGRQRRHVRRGRLPPKAEYGQRLPGHGGITVRDLAAAAAARADRSRSPRRPSASTPAGATSPGRCAAPATGPAVPRGRAPARCRSCRSPRRRPADSGLYLFEAHTRDAPDAGPARPSRRSKTAEGARRAAGDHLAGHEPGRRRRRRLAQHARRTGCRCAASASFANGLPAGLVQRVAPLLIHLDRTGLRYDLTTDLGLATNEGPRLEGHTGVVLAGDMRWLPAAQQRALRRFVRDGGKVATFGTDSLRRTGPRDAEPPRRPHRARAARTRSARRCARSSGRPARR